MEGWIYSGAKGVAAHLIVGCATPFLPDVIFSQSAIECTNNHCCNFYVVKPKHIKQALNKTFNHIHMWISNFGVQRPIDKWCLHTLWKADSFMPEVMGWFTSDFITTVYKQEVYSFTYHHIRSERKVETYSLWTRQKDMGQQKKLQ